MFPDRYRIFIKADGQNGESAARLVSRACLSYTACNLWAYFNPLVSEGSTRTLNGCLLTMIRQLPPMLREYFESLLSILLSKPVVPHHVQ